MEVNLRIGGHGWYVVGHQFTCSNGDPPNSRKLTLFFLPGVAAPQPMFLVGILAFFFFGLVYIWTFGRKEGSLV